MNGLIEEYPVNTKKEHEKEHIDIYSVEHKLINFTGVSFFEHFYPLQAEP
jgi:hypothetical protein